jgi:hypothetical protein
MFAILDYISEAHPAARVLCVTPSTLQPDWWLAHMRNLHTPDGGAPITESDRTIASNKKYVQLLRTIVKEWNKVRVESQDGKGNKVAIVDAFRAHAVAKGYMVSLRDKLQQRRVLLKYSPSPIRCCRS